MLFPISSELAFAMIYNGSLQGLGRYQSLVIIVRTVLFVALWLLINPVPFLVRAGLEEASLSI
ncbi:MAG: hypothetical protein ACPLSM_01265 [Thermosphaera sp.]